jgi:hypothetical protein
MRIKGRVKSKRNFVDETLTADKLSLSLLSASCLLLIAAQYTIYLSRIDSYLAVILFSTRNAVLIAVWGI